jgi:hypothetical protein
MSAAAYIQISPQALALVKRLGDTAAVMTAVARTMDRENTLTVASIQRDSLSFPRGGPSRPDGLRVQSGSLRRSLRASPAVSQPNGQSGGTVTSGIGGNVTSKGVNYLAVHEFGATIPPHTITATQARALCFIIGGKTVFAQSVRHPGMVLPARRMIRRGIEKRLPEIGAALSTAIIDTFGGKN